MALALGTKTARVMVNQNLNEGAGSVRNGLPYTLSLSCGSWGGNITTEYVNVRHFLNLTWVSRPVAPHPVAAEEVFGTHWAKVRQWLGTRRTGSKEDLPRGPSILATINKLGALTPSAFDLRFSFGDSASPHHA
jgi:hypothetical protein